MDHELGVDPDTDSENLLKSKTDIFVLDMFLNPKPIQAFL